MSNRLLAGLAVAALLLKPGKSGAFEPPDYSKEPFVIQSMATKVRFRTDGTREWQQTVSVRVQSEVAVRQFGILSLAYTADDEQPSVEYVRVKKADGSVIETPASSAVDVALTAAPTYSDLRQKQIPVKALGAGDLLEYSFRSLERQPTAPGQFWYQQSFFDNGVILDQTLEIRVPKDKYVQVSSPKLKSETREENNERVYVWKHSHLEPSKPDSKDHQNTAEDEPKKVQVTTFRNWEEVGKWWGALASEQASITPAIQSKAAELTAGRSTEEEKAKAIYEYVATKFRYISISFGVGRYRPHSAAEVLANQYGDCKDKHTLFAALLKAAGIQVWPALMGAGTELDTEVPSPAQLNHVITVWPQNGKYVWLDTTEETAPFGMLSQELRGEPALVIPATGQPLLLKTPLEPPFAASEIIDVKSSLAADGKLTGHFDIRMRGDDAVGMRAGFHQLAPAQWQEFTQQVSSGFGFSGDVSRVEVENAGDLEKPLHYGYDYQDKNYSDWKDHRITPPLPALGFGPGDEAEKPKKPFWAGAPGELIYRASVELPKGFSIELPASTTLSSSFADYSAHYSVQDGVFVAERKLTIKKSKVGREDWAEYQKFYKGVRADQGQYLVLSEAGADQKPTLSQNNPEAQLLLVKAYECVRMQDWNGARNFLVQAERLNPKQPGLWVTHSYLELSSGNDEKAIADLRKELEYHPEEMEPYRELTAILMHKQRRDEVIELWRTALSRKPDDEAIAWEAGNFLMQSKRYGEVPAILEKPLAAAPGNSRLRALSIEALLRSGKKEEGLAQAQKLAEATSDSEILNRIAYALADTDTAGPIAQELADKAVTQTERECAKLHLGSFGTGDLLRVGQLGAEWDTVGWVYFKAGDIAKAERYINASWQLTQYPIEGDHLGEIYEKQGKHDAAIHMWRLALAANNNFEEAKEHLRNAGASLEPVHVKRGKSNRMPVSPGEELGKLRTIGIPSLHNQTGSAEFFLLISPAGIEDVQFISGEESLKSAAHAIQTTKYEFPFPDAGPEKIIRRGILSCSSYTTPTCQLTLLVPSTVR